jgi:hypothetical protein
MKVNIGSTLKGGEGYGKEEVRIDDWDTADAQYTLALIILPLLKSLKQTLDIAGSL